MRTVVASCLMLLCAAGVAAQDSGSANAPAVPPAAQRPMAQRVRVSQGVMAAMVLKKVAPTYPKEARAKKIEGSVVLGIVISKTGDVSEIQVISGDELLVQSAVDAVKKWKFKPYLLAGQPVEVQTQATMNFELRR